MYTDTRLRPFVDDILADIGGAAGCTDCDPGEIAATEASSSCYLAAVQETTKAVVAMWYEGPFLGALLSPTYHYHFGVKIRTPDFFNIWHICWVQPRYSNSPKTEFL